MVVYSDMTIINPNRIAEARMAAGLTQQQLADALGVHWVTISKLENGKSRLTLERMSQIAPLLGVEPADLMPARTLEQRMRDDGGVQGRLKQAREEAGYASASAAARSFGWNENTYRSHENGERGIGISDVQTYAAAFDAAASWIAFGDENAKRAEAARARLGPAHTEAARLITGSEGAPPAERARARDAIIALAERLKIEAAQGMT